MGPATDHRQLEAAEDHEQVGRDRESVETAAGANAWARPDTAFPPHLQRLVASAPGGSPPAGLAASDLVALQRLVGNKAVSGLVSDRHGDGSPLAVQRAHNRSGRRRRGGPQRRRQGQGGATTTTPTTTSTTTPATAPTTAPSGQSGWSFGGIASWFGSALGLSSEGEGDHHLAGSEEEQTLSGTPEEDEEHELLAMPKIVIELGEHELESTLIGNHGSAKGTASGKAKGSLDGVEGSGKLEAEVGFDNALETGDLAYQVQGGELVGKGTVRGFVGAKVSAEGEVSAGSNGVAAKGKMAAFAGMSTEGETEIVVRAGARQVASFKGALGVAVGGGGELSGHIRFKGGEFAFGSKGKLAAGLGFTWEYEIRLEAAPIASGVFSWLSSLHSALTDFLTDDDGEPLLL